MFRLAIRFAGGAGVALLGMLVTNASVMPVIARMSGSGRPVLLTLVVVSAVWLLAGGLLAGTASGFRGRGRLGVGVAFMAAGVLLPFWLVLSALGGRGWMVVPVQGLIGAMVWAAAGLAGGLVLRRDGVTLREVVVGFALGGLLGGLCYTGYRSLMIARMLSVWPWQVMTLDGFVLAVVVPVFVAGVVLRRAADTMAGDADPA